MVPTNFGFPAQRSEVASYVGCFSISGANGCPREDRGTYPLKIALQRRGLGETNSTTGHLGWARLNMRLSCLHNNGSWAVWVLAELCGQISPDSGQESHTRHWLLAGSRMSGVYAK